MAENIHWLGHAGFKIYAGTKVIYIDPWRLEKTAEPADIILITHEHFDHLSLPDIKKISTRDTVIVTIPSAAREIGGNAKAVKPGDVLTLDGVTVEAVPAYNPEKAFHPRSDGKVGFIVTVGGERIYHAGDTDLIPEMDGIAADVALLPVGGLYTMDADAAAEAARKVGARIAVPMHWGSLQEVGGREAAEKFASLLTGTVDVRILPAER